MTVLLTVPSRAFSISERAAGEAAKFRRSGVKLLGVVSAAGLECGEPPAEAGELIRRQLGNSLGDFFDFFHVAQYSTHASKPRRGSECCVCLAVLPRRRLTEFHIMKLGATPARLVAVVRAADEQAALAEVIARHRIPP